MFDLKDRVIAFILMISPFHLFSVPDEPNSAIFPHDFLIVDCSFLSFIPMFSASSRRGCCRFSNKRS